MKFILTSNSYMVTKSWLKHLPKPPAQMSAVFIDTAADMYDKATAAWLQIDRQMMVDAGMTVQDYTLVGKSKKELIQDLSKVDLIFVSGGNTFYLLEHAQKSGFVKLIQENAFPKAVYVGSSAGSVLLSNDIDAIKFLDDPKEAKLTSTKAIGLLNSVLLPHWGSDKFKPRYVKTFEYAYQHAISVLTLADNQYIVIDEGSFELLEVT